MEKVKKFFGRVYDSLLSTLMVLGIALGVWLVVSVGFAFVVIATPVMPFLISRGLIKIDRFSKEAKESLSELEELFGKEE